MSQPSSIRSYIIFTGTGPILVLSTYPELSDAAAGGETALQGDRQVHRL
jgi:hypothetical protein